MLHVQCKSYTLFEPKADSGNSETASKLQSDNTALKAQLTKMEAQLKKFMGLVGGDEVAA